jgi:hypothetical protein
MRILRGFASRALWPKRPTTPTFVASPQSLLSAHSLFFSRLRKYGVHHWPKHCQDESIRNTTVMTVCQAHLQISASAGD